MNTKANEVRRVRETIRSVDNTLLAIRADGGYKYRSLIRLSDEELARITPAAEQTIRAMVLRLLAAENVIERWGRTKELEVEVETLGESLKALSIATPEVPKEQKVATQNRRQRRHPPRSKRVA